jgi:exodeoxyribonuclease VIII
MIKPGIFKDLDNEVYHGHKESISRSAIMDFRESPYRYWAKHLNPERPVKEKTEAMIFGGAFHTFILEPDKFPFEYAIKPAGIDRRTTKGKIAYEEFLAESAGKIELSQEEHKTLMQMRKAIRADSRAMQLIEGAQYETSLFWEDEETGLLLKSRPDIWHDNMIVDLKTIADASAHSFQRAMVSGGYHIQGAMIQDGIKKHTNHFIPNVINLCIEKEYPYSIGIYIIDDEALKSGKAQYKETLVDLKHALVNNLYPDYEVETIGLPKWAQ